MTTDLTHRVAALNGDFAAFRDRIKPRGPEQEVQALRAWTVQHVAKLQIDYELVIARLNEIDRRDKNGKAAS
jgi:hypothetical protein